MALKKKRSLLLFAWLSDSVASIWRFIFYSLFAYVILSSDSFPPIIPCLPIALLSCCLPLQKGLFFFHTLHFLLSCLRDIYPAYTMDMLIWNFICFEETFLISPFPYLNNTPCNILVIPSTFF